ncbi:unnamed protein product [Timema podura]|uniref:Vesicle transport protein n=1 Tax=Timema podura TaxID=61482 RepID=A0ABN7NLP7_TIMPD|nr:unnamed protein product [Timema podura]
MLFQLMDATTLSWSTRIKGFIICFVCGILCSLLGSLSMFLGKGMVMFAVFYTLGNIISIGSFTNSVKQLKLGKAGLTLLFVILQCLAMTWYSLSYIPYARDAVKKTVSSCIA